MAKTKRSKKHPAQTDQACSHCAELLNKNHGCVYDLPAGWHLVESTGQAIAPWVGTQGSHSYRVCGGCKRLWHCLYVGREDYYHVEQLPRTVRRLMQAGSTFADIQPLLANKQPAVQDLLALWFQHQPLDPAATINELINTFTTNKTDVTNQPKYQGYLTQLVRRLALPTETQHQLMRLVQSGELSRIEYVLEGVQGDESVEADHNTHSPHHEVHPATEQPAAMHSVPIHSRAIHTASGESSGTPAKTRLSLHQATVLLASGLLMLLIIGRLYATEIDSGAAAEALTAGAVAAFVNWRLIKWIRTITLTFACLYVSVLSLLILITAHYHYFHIKQQQIHDQIQQEQLEGMSPEWKALDKPQAFNAYMGKILGPLYAGDNLDHLRLLAHQGTISWEKPYPYQATQSVYRQGWEVYWNLLTMFGWFLLPNLFIVFVTLDKLPNKDDPYAPE